MNKIPNIKHKLKELQWFIGFSDAESNFYTTKKEDSQNFQIHLHIRDLNLLYKIKNILEFGNIYIDIKNERVSYKVSDMKTLYNNLIPIFELYPLLTRKKFQYLKFKEILNRRYIKKYGNINNKNIENKEIYKNINNYQWKNIEYYSNWLIGYIEGEGSFFFKKVPCNGILQSKKIPGFSICQKSDKEIIESIREKIGIIAKVKSKTYKLNDDIWQLSTHSKKGIKNIIDFIESSDIKFLGYKGIQYDLWLKNIREKETF